MPHELSVLSSAGGLTDWILTVMDSLGVVGVALLIAVENLFPPIPSEVILPLAGFTASQGEMSLPGVIAGATVGSLTGGLLLYGLGRAFGIERLRRWAVRLPLLDAADIDRTAAWFDRHGPAAVFFGRMIPVFRSLISLPAGVRHMGLGLFIALTAAGSLIWNTLFIGAGYLLGENRHVVEQSAGWFQRAVLAAVALAAAWWVLARLRRRRAQVRRPASTSGVVAGRAEDGGAEDGGAGSDSSVDSRAGEDDEPAG